MEPFYKKVRDLKRSRAIEILWLRCQRKVEQKKEKLVTLIITKDDNRKLGNKRLY